MRGSAAGGVEPIRWLLANGAAEWAFFAPRLNGEGSAGFSLWIEDWRND